MVNAFADDTCIHHIFKCNISISNGPIALKNVHRGVASIEEYIFMYMVNMAYMVQSGQLRANMPKEG